MTSTNHLSCKGGVPHKLKVSATLIMVRLLLMVCISMTGAAVTTRVVCWDEGFVVLRLLVRREVSSSCLHVRFRLMLHYDP